MRSVYRLSRRVRFVLRWLGSREDTCAGSLPAAVVERVVRARFDAMGRCFDAGLGRNPNLERRVSVAFVIERDGKVYEAREETASTTLTAREEYEELPNVASPIQDRAVAECVVAQSEGTATSK